LVRIKLDQDSFGLSSVMERITHARVKDSFSEGDIVYFVVAPGELGKAVGKGGIMIKKVQEKLGKKIRVIEYRDDVIAFVRNVIYPIRVEEIVEQEGIVIIRDNSKVTKGKLIGRGGSNLVFINRAVKRFFGKEVKVE
jgi:transcription termination/antitermination protein NusA